MEQTKKDETCCECCEKIPKNTNFNMIKICSCKKLICMKCYEQHQMRAKRSPDFYTQYIGVCDTCIWFDIG